MEVSRRCSSILGSLTLEITARVKAMKSQGHDVIGFGAGEPDFGTPQWIVDAAKEALDKGLTRYTPASGTPELKQAICDRYKRKYGLAYEAAQVVVSNGAKHSLFNVFQAILNPGDEVIIPAPYWLSYPELVKMADGVPVIVDTAEENDFKMTADALLGAVTPRTKAVIMNNPSNPTGSVYAREELKKVLDAALEHGLCIVADDIYEELIYDGKEMVCIPTLGDKYRENTIIISGASKTYAMTGWRIGYALSPVHIAKAMGNYQSHSTSNPNSIAQYATIAALNGPEKGVEEMRSAFDARRRTMYERINAIEGLSCRLPSGAFYMMMNLSGVLGRKWEGQAISGSMDFTSFLLEAQKVAVVPGISFGADHYVRMSYATSMENIEKGLERIKAFCASLT
ncbi:MAG: pyridoxal phosphate-dependent aminotransferase [Bacillota bacterium]